MKISSGYFLFINLLILLQSISINSTTAEAEVNATSEISCNLNSFKICFIKHISH